MIFVLAVMRVVGGVPLWVVCVFRCMFVSVVHPVAILSAVFCVICSWLMFVSDASGDYMVETYSSIDIVIFFMRRFIENSKILYRIVENKDIREYNMIETNAGARVNIDC